MAPLCLVFFSELRHSPMLIATSPVPVFSGADELGVNAWRSPTKSPPMTPRDGWQMFNAKVRKTRGRGARQKAFLPRILQSGGNKRDRKDITSLPEPDVSRIKSSCDCCKSWPVRHMSQPGLISSAGNFWILYYSCIPCCMETTEGSYSCSVPMFSFATDVTV